MKFQTSIVGLFQIYHAFIVLPILISVLLKVPTIQGEAMVSPELLKKPSSNIAIIMTHSTLPLIDKISKMHFEDNPMWADNVIFVERAFPTLIQLLLNLPEAFKLKQIREQIVLKVPEVFNVKLQGTAPTVESPAWGISKINCTDYWKKYGNGTGCRVATIDTGCNTNHEALHGNYIGPGGWFDPNVPQTNTTGSTIKPTDAQGHGSHCMGSICGAHGVGCAPGAKWMACRGCGTAFCTEADLCNCGQWLVCRDGKDASKRCPNTPDVISCSWGGTDSAGNNFYDSIIAVWIACKIFVAFANGNSGPDCSTTGYPASNPKVCSVGATNNQDQVSSFSSRGPTLNGTMAPNFCCPGESILSCSNVQNGYQTMSGTSMATPHMAGAVALLRGSCPDATNEDIMDALMNSAVKEVGGAPGTCSNNDQSNQCGKGRINCVKARENLASKGCPLPK